ncbi:MAG: FRG domain-containing protein [Chloroflexi bacterium]|nr:FRG domain-containing protein [Chloroflexota bacterium]
MKSETENEKEDLFKDVTIPCKTAREFLDNLDLTHPRWSRQHWVFRGQNDACWELVPSLFRKWNRGTNPGLELALIRLFISNANLAQLPIPNNSLGYFSSALKPTVRELNTGVSYDFSHVVFAIAQHSGVPTRLLDFSHSPLVAAYFAIDFASLYESLGLASDQLAQYFRRCADCYTDGDDVEATIAELVDKVKLSMDNLPDEVAVWAVQAQDLGDYTSIKLLEHPFMEILPLRMQKGLFLCDTDFAEEEVQQGQKWPSLDAKLATLIETDGIYKLTMPYVEAEALHDLLTLHQFSQTVVTPSYEAVAKQTVALAYEIFGQNRETS